MATLVDFYFGKTVYVFSVNEWILGKALIKHLLTKITGFFDILAFFKALSFVAIWEHLVPNSCKLQIHLIKTKEIK